MSELPAEANEQGGAESPTQTQAPVFIGVTRLVDARNSMFALKELGVDNDEIRESLIEKGLTPEQAAQMIASMEVTAISKLKSAKAEMVRGGLILAAGLLVTILTFSASKGAGFLLMWGAVIGGAIDFFMGVSGTIKYRSILSNIAIDKMNG